MSIETVLDLIDDATVGEILTELYYQGVLVELGLGARSASEQLLHLAESLVNSIPDAQQRRTELCRELVESTDTVALNRVIAQYATSGQIGQQLRDAVALNPEFG